MKKIARLINAEKQELFHATAIKMGMRPEIIEKDFWVCYMLDHLFHECEYKDTFVFKGGTSLSKSYHVIKRFSEDIDLILDWRKIIKDGSDPWDERSKTKQDAYNKQINKAAALFYEEKLVPQLNGELSGKLGEGKWVAIDDDDELVVNFAYPQIFQTEYIVPYVRLEIGPLAEWTPSHITNITPFAAEQYGQLFEQKSTDVLTIDAERTFWEKIAILHKIANFSEDKVLPYRYARHLYDVYCLGHSDIKALAFEKKTLLAQDILFKQKFYYSKSAHYETASTSTIKLVPGEHVTKSLKADYAAMSNMFYENAPEFDEVLKYLGQLESEIHNL